MQNVKFQAFQSLDVEMTRWCANDKSAGDHLSPDIRQQEYDKYFRGKQGCPWLGDIQR